MSLERRDRWILGVAFVVACAAVVFQAAVHRAHFVDDAYIGFRYAENLRAGHGAVWTPGEPPVEGVTNLGWVLVLAALGSFASLPAVAKAAGLVSLLATIGLATVLHRRLAPLAGPVERAALPLLLAAQPELVYFSLAGMETGLAALVATAGIGVAAVLDSRIRSAVGAALALAAVAVALFLLRPEMALVVPLFAALRWASGDRAARRGIALLLVATLAGLALVTAWRFLTYSELLPNTFAAKASGGFVAVTGRLLAAPLGGNVNLPPPFGLGLAVMAFGAWRLRRARGNGAGADFAITLAAAGVAFAIYARPDWTGLGRYFAPFVPAAMLLLLRGTAEITARVSPTRARPVLAGVVVLLAGHGALRHAEHLTGPALAELPGFVLVSESLVSPAHRVAALLPSEATVACRRIGVLGYVTRARVFDFAYGLTEPQVARALRHAGVPYFDNARTAALREIWRRVEPDYLLEDWTRLESWLAPGETARHFRIHGVPYEVVASFPIAQGHERWALARRIPGEAVVEEEDWRAGAERAGPRDPLER